jgi:hypothetical protein
LAGLVECRTWLKARRDNDATAFENYLVGLLNGVAVGARIEFWNAGGTTVSKDQTYLWMDNYCQRSAHSNVVSGAMDLIDERTAGGLKRALRTP